MALVAGACGGDDGDATGGDGAPAATSAPSTTDDGSDDPPATQPPEPDDDASGGEGPSTATVTIGDETYTFSSDGAIVAQCLPDLFGIFSVGLPMAEGGDGTLSLIALHEGTDPEVVEQTNVLAVTIGDIDWVADPEDLRIVDNPAVAAGQTQIDSVEVDGNTVRGTASFVGSSTVFSADFVEFATGTFEATCGEERTS